MSKITTKLELKHGKAWPETVNTKLKEAWQLQKDLLVTIEEYPQSGKWSMSRLWRSWMKSTAEFMANNGVTMPLMIKPSGEYYGKRAFDETDAHELFTAQWLGVDSQGSRLSWAKTGDNIASKGQRFNAMMKHEHYMIERGIKHLIPRESEYFIEKEKCSE